MLRNVMGYRLRGTRERGGVAFKAGSIEQEKGEGRRRIDYGEVTNVNGGGDTGIVYAQYDQINAIVQLANATYYR